MAHISEKQDIQGKMRKLLEALWALQEHIDFSIKFSVNEKKIILSLGEGVSTEEVGGV